MPAGTGPIATLRVGDPGRLAVGADQPGAALPVLAQRPGLGRRGAPRLQRPLLGPLGELPADLGLTGVGCLVHLADLRRGPARHALSEGLRLAPGGGAAFSRRPCITAAMLCAPCIDRAVIISTASATGRPPSSCSRISCSKAGRSGSAHVPGGLGGR